eukprot:NODE_653_length_4981_cov_0.275092.p6 type:complete len:131 gc:universal NODE_653_length_4981_cov_0.275092:3-395(+)
MNQLYIRKVLGTPEFMAPEMWKKQESSNYPSMFAFLNHKSPYIRESFDALKSDIYSLGATMGRLFQISYFIRNPNHVFSNCFPNDRRQYELLMQSKDESSRPLLNIIFLMTQCNPENRPSANELLKLITL